MINWNKKIDRFPPAFSQYQYALVAASWSWVANWLDSHNWGLVPRKFNTILSRVFAMLVEGKRLFLWPQNTSL